MIYVFLTLLSAHWIADFVCQTHWQASNKSKNWNALFRHVFVYSCIVTIFAIIFLPDNKVIWFLLITFVTHFITDAITSRINSYLWEKKDIHNFFVSIGFDQLIHQITLAATIIYLS